MKTVETAGGNLTVKFDYDEKILKEVKQIPGRRYNAGIKGWEVPARFISQCHKLLAPLGFIFSPAAMQLMAGPEITSIKSDLPLYNFQKEGVLFLLNNESALLGDEPGLGKTIQALAAIKELDCDKVLWITMKSLIYSTQAEIKKWMPEASVLIIDAEINKAGKARRLKDIRLAKWKEDARFYIVNYEKMRADIGILTHFEWPMLVMDEVSKIHSPQAIVSKAAQLLKARRKILMTGTPISNAPSDLWVPMNIIAPELLGSWWQFRSKYCEFGYWGEIKNYKELDHLSRAVAPYILRREKKEVLKDLPERTVENILFGLGPAERKIYEAVKKEILYDLEKIDLSKVDWGTINQTLVKLVRLRQITGSLELVGEKAESSKAEALFELLETLPKNVIIFTQFGRMAEILHKNISGSLLMTGKTAAAERQRATEEFNKGGKALITTEVAGYGLNLQTSSVIINYDSPWSIAKYEQRIGRIERIGSKEEKITVFNLIARDTVDEFVQETLNMKKKTANGMFEEIKKILR